MQVFVYKRKRPSSGIPSSSQEAQTYSSILLRVRSSEVKRLYKNTLRAARVIGPRGLPLIPDEIIRTGSLAPILPRTACHIVNPNPDSYKKVYSRTAGSHMGLPGDQ